MKQSSISKEYFICSIEGKSFFSSTESKAGLVVAGLLDLIRAGVLAVQGKKLEVKTELPESLNYLAGIYNYVAEKPRTMEKVMDDFCMAMTEKRIKELINSVGMFLAEADLVEPGQKGVFKKEVYIPDQKYKDTLVEQIRNNMLGSGEMTEKDVILVCLLEAAGILKKLFSKDEVKALESKVKEVRENPDYQMMKEMLRYTDEVLAMWVACMVSAMVIS